MRCDIIKDCGDGLVQPDSCWGFSSVCHLRAACSCRVLVCPFAHRTEQKLFTGKVEILPHVAAGNIPQLGWDLFTMFKEDAAFAYLLPSAGSYGTILEWTVAKEWTTRWFSAGIHKLHSERHKMLGRSTPQGTTLHLWMFALHFVHIKRSFADDYKVFVFNVLCIFHWSLSYTLCRAVSPNLLLLSSRTTWLS